MQQLSFLQPPPFTPQWPTPGSMTDLALGWLLAGEALDHPAFQARTKSWRLAAYVADLRAMGWPVDTVPAPAPIAEAPHRTIASYALPARVIALARQLRKG